jgi:hypothetical protein
VTRWKERFTVVNISYKHHRESLSVTLVYILENTCQFGYFTIYNYIRKIKSVNTLFRVFMKR